MTDKPTLEDWQALAAKEVKGRDLTWHTPEGIAVKPLYTAADVAGIDPGLPGFAPFTRGVRASMYAGRPWTIRQYAGFSTLGADSLDTVELIMEFEKEFDIQIPDDQAENIVSVGQAIEFIEKSK